MRVEPNKLDELLHPVFDLTALAEASLMAEFAGITRCRNRTNCVSCRRSRDIGSRRKEVNSCAYRDLS